MDKNELMKLRKEIDKLEDDLYYKRTFLFDHCPHDEMRRIDRGYKVFDIDYWGNDYECLLCKQKWESDHIIESFEKKVIKK